MQRIFGSLTVLIALALAACGGVTAPPSSSAASAAAKPASNAPSVVAKPASAAPASAASALEAAARQEGSLVLQTNDVPADQQAFAKFAAKYPWLKLELSDIPPHDFHPRVISEQRNGQHLWDLQVGGGLHDGSLLLGPPGAMEDIKPYLQGLPNDAIDESKWGGGFARYYAAPGSPDAFVSQVVVNGGLYVDRAQVPASALGSSEQLLDPQFKGKIVLYDATHPGGGATYLSALSTARGLDFVKNLLTQQAPVINTDTKQVAQWIMTGRYPIAIGAEPTTVKQFKDQGVGTQVESLLEPAVSTLNENGIVALSKPPHPNAIKLFLGWFLSQEGQDAWANAGRADQASRRTDVKSPSAEVPDWTKLNQYNTWSQSPDATKITQDVIDLAKTVH